ncbi:MAG: hypothetical protein JW891_01175 [Candidatus Lokiarchaeota archaeon]|nr:hypothetical protein [Candidatus Lokiarchaeota archaeon]
MKKIVEESINIDKYTINIDVFQMHKSHLMLISDQEDMGIGNVTLSSPPVVEGLNSIAASYNLFGMNEGLLSKIIAERASKILKTPVLLLFFLKEVKKEEDIMQELTSSVNDILDKIKK